MQWIVLFLTAALSMSAHSHEIQSITQHVNLRKQDQSGWQQDVIAKVAAGSKFIFGAQATYLERFDLYEKRGGTSVAYRPDDRWNFELKFLKGNGNEILPETDITFTTYYSLGQGLTPFLIYRDAQYSVTHLHAAILGLEIEKIAHVIFIPTVMLGRATFNQPAKTEDVYSVGLRVSYYVENQFALSLFGAKGKEASQGIVGRSAVLVDTLSGGASVRYNVTSNFQAELTFDHTDYDDLGTEFHTTTLNLSRMF